MQDQLEAPPGKISRISNLAPSDNRRQDSLLPLSILIVGAVAVAIGLAFDLALVINAGGIPGVFVLPTITKTTDDATQVNSVVNKVAAVVDDLAGDEEEYIVEDQAEDFPDEYEIEDNLFEDDGDNDNNDDDNDDNNDDDNDDDNDEMMIMIK